MRRRTLPTAFTLIELLVVVALIAILGSLLVMGIGKMQTNAKRQSTRLTMQVLSAMFDEYQKSARQAFPSLNDLMSNTTYLNHAAMPCPQNVNADYFASVNPTGVFPPPSATPAADRQGLAVQLTRDVMSQFRKYPANAAALGKMSSSALMTFPITRATVTWAAGMANNMLDRVSYDVSGGTNPQDFVCVEYNYSPYSATPRYLSPVYSFPAHSLPGGGLGPATNVDPYRWIEGATDPSVPLVLDAWGNPIIFVYGGALGLDPATSPAPATGFLNAGGNKFQVVSPDGTPFFASAGPDGDFSKGDDNLYSFDK